MFDINEEGVLKKYFPDEEESAVRIPDEVTAILPGAFDPSLSLDELYVPGSVKVIESGTFENCSGISRFKLGSGVTAIRAYAFAGCGNVLIEVPQSVRKISASAFDSQKTFKFTRDGHSIIVPMPFDEKHHEKTRVMIINAIALAALSNKTEHRKSAVGTLSQNEITTEILKDFFNWYLEIEKDLHSQGRSEFREILCEKTALEYFLTQQSDETFSEYLEAEVLDKDGVDNALEFSNEDGSGVSAARRALLLEYKDKHGFYDTADDDDDAPDDDDMPDI